MTCDAKAIHIKRPKEEKKRTILAYSFTQNVKTVVYKSENNDLSST